MELDKRPLLIPLEDYTHEKSQPNKRKISTDKGRTSLPFSYRDPNEYPILLDVHIIWCALYDINCSLQTYSALLEIWLAWNLTEEELDLYLKDPNNWFPTFTPSIYPINAVTIDQLEYYTFANRRNVQVYQSKTGTVKACQCVLLSGNFTESFELKNFPFDVQHLNCQIYVRTENDNFKVVEGNFVKEVDNRSGYINWSGKFQTHVWINPKNTKFSCVVGRMSFAEYTIENTEITFFNRDSDLPHVSCRIVMKRNWRYYFWKVYFLLAIISFSCLATFFFGQSTISDRINYLSTLLLSAVAFLFVVASTLPSLGYLTMLDMFLYASFGEILVIGIVNLVLSKFNLFDTYEESLALYSIFAIWIVKNMVFVLMALHAYNEELKKLKMIKEEVDEGTEYEKAMMANTNEEYGEFCNFKEVPHENEKVRRVYSGKICNSFNETPWIVD